MNRRNTHQKQIIAAAVKGQGVHRTAEEVLAIARQEEPGIGLATVYRNLNLLAEAGQVQKFNVNGTAVYDGNPEPHDHLYCTCCGRLQDVAGNYDDAMDHETARRNHVRILRHSVLYEGICEECLKKEEMTWN